MQRSQLLNRYSRFALAMTGLLGLATLLFALLSLRQMLLLWLR